MSLDKIELDKIEMEENVYSKKCVACGKIFYSKGKEPVGICKECSTPKILGNWIVKQNEYFQIIKEILANRKTPIYHITSIGGEYLGEIKWFGAWRKFCFYPEEYTVWDNKCLNDVIKFLDEINKEWREKRDE